MLFSFLFYPSSLYSILDYRILNILLKNKLENQNPPYLSGIQQFTRWFGRVSPLHVMPYVNINTGLRSDSLGFNVVVFEQAYRERADRATDQSQFEGDHDAERPGECHLQRGESVLQVLDLKMLQPHSFIADIFKGCRLRISSLCFFPAGCVS